VEVLLPQNTENQIFGCCDARESAAKLRDGTFCQERRDLALSKHDPKLSSPCSRRLVPSRPCFLGLAPSPGSESPLEATRSKHVLVCPPNRTGLEEKLAAAEALKFLKSTFFQVRRALPEATLAQYEARQAEQALLSAKLDNLVRCPFCDFACEVDEGNRVLDCPGCKKVSLWNRICCSAIFPACPKSNRTHPRRRHLAPGVAGGSHATGVGIVPFFG
jgi:hypothetical protein